ITDALRARVGVASEPRRVTVSPELVRRMRETLADGPVPHSEIVPPAGRGLAGAGDPPASAGGVSGRLPRDPAGGGRAGAWRAGGGGGGGGEAVPPGHGGGGRPGALGGRSGTRAFPGAGGERGRRRRGAGGVRPPLDRPLRGRRCPARRGAAAGGVRTVALGT